MKTKNKHAAIIGTLTKYRNMFLFHLGYVGSNLPVTAEVSKVPFNFGKERRGKDIIALELHSVQLTSTNCVLKRKSEKCVGENESGASNRQETYREQGPRLDK